MVQPVQPPQAQQPTVPTLQAPPAVSGVYNPSALAAQESGAIGAASIASQMPKPKTSAFAQAAKPKPYSVQRGDTLSAIAAKNKMSLKQLMKLNPQFTQNAKYQGGNRIFSGTKVNLAPKAPKAPTTPASFNPGSFRLAENKGM
jgi:LysM repeat protein